MEYPQNHVLIPIDFSEQTYIALSQSYNIARHANAQINLVHVIDDERFSFFKSLLSKHEDLDNEIEQAALTKLQELAENAAKESGLLVNAIIARGKPYEEIVRMAEKLECKFIIMGTNGSVGIKRFIGSNALRVIKEAMCPVITIKGKTHAHGCKTIVLPLDMTQETREKVSKAVEIAKFFGSTIKVLAVFTSDDEFINNKLSRQLDQVSDFIAEKGVSCTADSVKGSDVAEEVIKYAEKVKADLTMIMTQKEMNWTDLFIGSAAQEVINNSDNPVLSIRPMPRKDTTVFVPY